MAMINNRNIEIVRGFFFDELILLADQLKRKRRSFFSDRPNPGAKTYYVKRRKTSMLREDFETPCSHLPQDFDSQLAELWKSQGFAELTILVKSLSKLVSLLYQIEEQGEEISPFIYIMY